MTYPTIVGFDAAPRQAAPGDTVTLTAEVRQVAQTLTGRLAVVGTGEQREVTITVTGPVGFVTDPAAAKPGQVLVTLHTDSGRTVPLVPGDRPGVFTATAPAGV